MQIHNVVQGTLEWHALRAQHYCASDMAAILGLSKYKTRNQLLHEKATGITPDQSDKQWLFDKGHEAEALARPIGERIAGEDLFPCVGTLDIEGLPFLASFDGITMSESESWEHKLYAEQLVACIAAGDLPDENWPQVEAQLLVSGANRTLFMCSDGTEENCAWFWYESKPERRARLVAGVKQFSEDVRSYVPVEAAVAPVAAPILALPAVSVQVNGALAVVSNLDAFGARLTAFCDGIKTKPQTDQDFVDLKASIKVLEKAEEALLAAQAGALEQVVEVAELQRMVGLYHKIARDTRLATEKLVKAETENRKFAIQQAGKDAIAEHFAGLNARLGKSYMPLVPSDISGVCRGLSSFDSMKNKVDTEVARWKIEANAVADRIQLNLSSLRELAADYAFLFADTAQIVLKQNDDLVALVKTRIADHQAAEAKRIEAEREKIRAEEQAKAERLLAASKAASAQTQAAETVTLRQVVHAAAPAAVAESIAPSTPPTLTLGNLGKRLGFDVRADFLRTLGFEGQKDRAATLYRESDFPRICTALIRHLENVSYKQSAAA